MARKRSHIGWSGSHGQGITICSCAAGTSVAAAAVVGYLCGGRVTVEGQLDATLREQATRAVEVKARIVVTVIDFIFKSLFVKLSLEGCEGCMKMVLEEGSLKVVFVITDRDKKWGEKGFYIGAESNFSPWWGLEVTWISRSLRVSGPFPPREVVVVIKTTPRGLPKLLETQEWKNRVYQGGESRQVQ